MQLNIPSIYIFLFPKFSLQNVFKKLLKYKLDDVKSRKNQTYYQSWQITFITRPDDYDSTYNNYKRSKANIFS